MTYVHGALDNGRVSCCCCCVKFAQGMPNGAIPFDGVCRGKVLLPGLVRAGEISVLLAKIKVKPRAITIHQPMSVGGEL